MNSEFPKKQETEYSMIQAVILELPDYQDEMESWGYRVSVRIEITAESLEDGEEVSVFGSGFFKTNYCSNNFEECRLWTGIDPASANSYSDHYIKQEYSAAQLLEYYRQGLEL